MNSPRMAVWLLELVTSPDRASTTVGDFAEESAEHGRGWFWRQIARTFLAQAAREFTSAPGRLLFCLPMGPLFYLFTVLVWSTVLHSIFPLWQSLYYTVVSEPEGNFIPPAPGQGLLILLIIAVVHLRGGWDLARVTKRPLATSLVFALGCSLFWSFVEVNHVRHVHFIGVPQVLVFIGAIWQRRRSLRTA